MKLKFPALDVCLLEKPMPVNRSLFSRLQPWGYPFVSRNGIVAVWEKKVGIRYQA